MHVSNVVAYTTNEIASFEAQRNLEESDLALEASRLISTSNQNYQLVLNSNFSRMIQLKADYKNAIIKLNTDKEVSPAKRALEKAALDEQLIANKTLLETTLQSQMNAAQDRVTASYQSIKETHNARKLAQLEAFQQDIST